MFKDATAFAGVDFAFRSLLGGCKNSKPSHPALRGDGGINYLIHAGEFRP
jgi:hypothetical protein